MCKRMLPPLVTPASYVIHGKEYTSKKELEQAEGCRNSMSYSVRPYGKLSGSLYFSACSPSPLLLFSRGESFVSRVSLCHLMLVPKGFVDHSFTIIVSNVSTLDTDFTDELYLRYVGYKVKIAGTDISMHTSSR